MQFVIFLYIDLFLVSRDLLKIFIILESDIYTFNKLSKLTKQLNDVLKRRDGLKPLHHGIFYKK